MENQNNINTEVEEIEMPSEFEVIGVKFKPAGKTYYFSPEGMKFQLDDKVIVRTSRGIEFGFVACENKSFHPLKLFPLCARLKELLQTMISSVMNQINSWKSRLLILAFR